MQQDLFFNGPPIGVRLLLLGAVVAGCGFCLTCAVLAIVSRTWRSRLGHAALHALWVIPVIGLFVGAIAWRVHESRTQVVSTTPWPPTPTLTVPATPWPVVDSSLQLPRTETFQVPTTSIHYSVAPTWGLIVLVGIGVSLLGAVLWRFMRRHAATVIPVAGVVAALAIVAAGLAASFAAHEQRVAEAAQRSSLVARAVTRQQRSAAMQAQQGARPTAPHASQALDYRGTPDEAPPAGAPDVSDDSARDAAGAEIIAYVGSIPTGERLTELPDWARETSSSDDFDDSLTRTYASELWVTDEEADQELLRNVAPAVQRSFWSEYPAAADWSPSPELILQSGAVTRRCYESIPVQFGEHTQTMHRGYWQVTRTSDVSRFFFDHWRPLAVRQRLIWGASAVGLLTLIFSSLGAYFRLNAATAGRYRGRLRFATGAVCVAGGLAAILLA